MYDLETVIEYAEKIRNPNSKNQNSNRKIVLWGHSLGTVVSTRAIKETHAGRYLDALVLEAAHSDLIKTVVVDHPWPEIIRKIYGKFLVSKGVDYFKTGLKLDRFNSVDNVDEVAKLSLATVILHAEDDEEVPVEHADEIFTALKNKIPELYYFKAAAGEKLGHYCLDGMVDRWSGVLERLLENLE